MKLTTRYSLITATLIGAVVGSVYVATSRAQRAALEAQSSARQQGLQDGVLRLAQESLDQRDPLMLISYLMYVQRSRPEVKYASITRGGHTSTVGSDGQGLVYWSQKLEDRDGTGYVSLKDGASQVVVESGKPAEGMTITLGYSKELLEADIDAALKPLARRTTLIALAFVGLGWLGSLGAAKLVAGPITALTAAVGAVGRGKLDVAVPVSGNDEIGMLGRRFNEMTARLREFTQFREDVLHTLTHELNTPLGGIKGYIEIWQERGLPAEPARREDALRAMGGAVNRMENSLQHALKLFREEAQATGPRTLIWLDDVLREVATLCAPIARQKKIEIVAPSDEAAECVYADEELVRRVATNLVSNALKYTGEGGKVVVTLGGDAGRARFTVADTGRGMSKEDLGKIFTKFYRAGAQSERVPGTGLGLSIAHRAVQELGGEITVQSELGKGTVFTVELPRKLPKTKSIRESLS